MNFSSGHLNILQQLNNAERWLGWDMQRTEMVIKIISFILTDCMHSNTWCSSMQLWEYHDEVASKCLLVIKRFHPPLFMLTQAYWLNCRSWQAMAKIRWGSRFYAGLKFTVLYLWKTVNISCSDLKKKKKKNRSACLNIIKYLFNMSTMLSLTVTGLSKLIIFIIVYPQIQSNPSNLDIFGDLWSFSLDQSVGPTLQILIILFLTNTLIILLINPLVSHLIQVVNLVHEMLDKGG